MFSLSSCSDDDENESPNPLVGTTWESLIEEALFTETHTIKFSESNFSYDIVSEYDGDGEKEKEKQHTSGSYTVDLPSVYLVIEGEKVDYTLSGNQLIPNNSEYDVVFTKK